MGSDTGLQGLILAHFRSSNLGSLATHVRRWLVLEIGTIGLDKWLRERNHSPSWAETLDVGHALGSALAFIHGHNMVCGDVKPANGTYISRDFL